MPLINLKDASLSFSNLEILKNSMLHIHKNERICLIGKNGTGKSTLLKIINKKQDLDHGCVIYKKNIKISYLKQENPKNLNISIHDFIISGFYKIYTNSNNSYNIESIKKKLNMDQIVKIEKTIELIELKKNTLLSELSGGLLRKVALSRVLIDEPDVLLLDEPTNHLDIKTVKWLENFLKKFHGSILFVSHDRGFIQNISTRIVDLDRGKLISWPGNYENFIKLKNDSNRIEKIQKKIFDKNLEKEEKWIRKGIKARSTRNEGRVKNLQLLRKENNDYKKIEKLNNITINQDKNYLGKIIFKVDKIDFSFKKKLIIKNFSSIIQHGDKLALIGANGCGKSTMIKLLIGEKKPTKGEIYKSQRLKISYFDQNRSILNPNKSIIDNISYGKETVLINGKEQYLIGYLKKFLFKPNQLNSLVKTLSGGECNRLLLARLFLTPSNVLILDEPTNDLDLDTLELLEKIIINYKGTVLIVSHDEKFINNTVNKCWFFEKNGLINTYVGNYDCLKKEQNNLIKEKKNITRKTHHQLITHIKKNHKTVIKEILIKIEKIECDINKLQKIVNELNFFQKKREEKVLTLKMLIQKEKELEEILIYWEQLEKKHNQ
ncbi:ATP-binding cassette domain-containing protein [Buchnera aphidicola]|uniref:ATP-binding protein Uup n=1 Tax=Buchnera aphidicola str. USDA (Myzus persicae) TaxID=1009856 RepID=W0NZW5_BUCMP|nr:ATP-binding cassette domain-containing protein [Buchnera aphidicola]AHG60024.1 Uup [Buchnera aphidicola str. USDA (Myzus persicae)]AHG60604.1 Uup [Buchnera aphidicola str. W106 (Myzus persicae)]AHG61176.1 Uup [Buchnera aphidicola str. G002 (Myzus persicae)]AHG61749.1 Uup [Buchnera aphidicola str. F009 (Myzus persicae)]